MPFDSRFIKQKLLELFPESDFSALLQEHNAIIAGEYVLSNVVDFDEAITEPRMNIYINRENVNNFLYDDSYGSPFIDVNPIDTIMIRASSQSYLFGDAIIGIIKYTINGINISIMVVDDDVQFRSVIDSFDLSFCKIWYDGVNITCFETEYNIREKVGSLSPFYVKQIMYFLDTVVIERVKLYLRRGFKIVYTSPFPEGEEVQFEIRRTLVTNIELYAMSYLIYNYYIKDFIELSKYKTFLDFYNYFIQNNSERDVIQFKKYIREFYFYLMTGNTDLANTYRDMVQQYISDIDFNEGEESEESEGEDGEEDGEESDGVDIDVESVDSDDIDSVQSVIQTHYYDEYIEGIMQNPIYKILEIYHPQYKDDITRSGAKMYYDECKDLEIELINKYEQLNSLTGEYNIQMENESRNIPEIDRLTQNINNIEQEIRKLKISHTYTKEYFLRLSNISKEIFPDFDESEYYNILVAEPLDKKISMYIPIEHRRYMLNKFVDKDYNYMYKSVKGLLTYIPQIYYSSSFITNSDKEELMSLFPFTTSLVLKEKKIDDYLQGATIDIVLDKHEIFDIFEAETYTLKQYLNNDVNNIVFILKERGQYKYYATQLSRLSQPEYLIVQCLEVLEGGAPHKSDIIPNNIYINNFIDRQNALSFNCVKKIINYLLTVDNNDPSTRIFYLDNSDEERISPTAGLHTVIINRQNVLNIFGERVDIVSASHCGAGTFVDAYTNVYKPLILQPQ